MLLILVGSQVAFGSEKLSSPAPPPYYPKQASSASIDLGPALTVTPQAASTSGAKQSNTASKSSVPVVVAAPVVKDQIHSYGIAGGSRLAGLSADELSIELNDMASLGISWVRFDIEWPNVQPDNASQQNWSDYDRVVSAVRARNMSVLGIIDYTPSWARASGCSSAQCPPKDPSQYATFAAKVAARYAPQGVHTWEVWNEPNSSQFWVPKADANAYTQVLKAAYPAIKAVDSSATVISGGLAPQSTDGQNISRRDFLMQIYTDGAKGYFDAVADHPYTFPRLPADNTDRAWSEMSTTPNSLRATMIANGDGAKKIWITEYGAPTGGPGPTATPADSETVVNTWHVDESLQSNILLTAVNLYKTYDWVGPFFWYSNKDAGTSQSTNENFFGLIRADNSKKPAYTTYQQIIH